MLRDRLQDQLLIQTLDLPVKFPVVVFNHPLLNSPIGLAMNNLSSTIDRTDQLTSQAAATADAAIRSTEKLTHDALNGLAESANGLRNELGPMIHRASGQVSDLAHRGADAVRQRSHQLSEGAEAATVRTRDYIRDEPVKSVLIAAATGAALMGLLSLISHTRRSH
jgi:ElaB/YqjD/DUF883 family membrane-anchored ribosome-binding protein